ncbi:hypothetical protein HHK36_029428 [Tetracentron sinense]|uniref:Uncharacterized protein n=1 Tax=Tetracentron sinense TaxID=13715 RepID=A0A834YDP4_TETSI|nr:hypothetical protein HHK36_029428 [Tetracentron sinense]
MMEEGAETRGSEPTAMPQSLSGVPEPESSPDPLTFARSYQLEALEKALRENTIAFLDTGSGKTLIAIMLLRNYAHLLRKPSPFIAVFLVPTVVLVTQQAEAIEMHTDLKVGKYWGEMGVDYWDAATWKKELDKYEVFVMTPQILLDDLRHSFFKLDIIKLLIFDECHNARGRSPYACILTVYTVANESVLAKFVPLSTPKLKFYKHHVQSLKELHLSDCAEESAKKKISKLFANFIFCLTELGVWLALKAAESLSCTETANFFCGQNDMFGDRIVRSFSQDVSKVFLKYIPSGREWSIGNNVRANLVAGFLTAKVNCLIESLQEYRNLKDLRCIIFVERVITSIVLQSLLSQLPQLSGWKTTYMAGNQSGLQSQTRKEQIKIIEAFREGMVNIIVATQILEEGLDVQSCNLVIRFDPSATVCSFIQSRGRARMRGSDYLLIVKSGDASTLSRVKNYLASGDIMRKESLRHASLPCAPFESEMYDEDFYLVESTGAIVTLSSSVALIYFYCSRLPSDGFVLIIFLSIVVKDVTLYVFFVVSTLRSYLSSLFYRYFRPAPIFSIDKESSVCTLQLPKSCPIQTVPVQGNNNMLKQLSCLEACKKLHEIGALTDNLLPELVVEEAEDFGNVSYEDEQVSYFPGELVSHSPLESEQLYHCYSIKLKQNFEYGVPFNDIVLVLRCELESEIANMNFDLEVSRGSVTVNMVYAGILHLSAEQVLIARRFQITVLRVLIDHNLTKLKDVVDRLHQGETLPVINYLLLPTTGCNQKSSVVDWDCVRSALFSSAVGNVGGGHMPYCSAKGCVRWMQTKDGVVCSCMLVNSLVFTPHNGHIYCISGILDDLNGNSLLKLKGEVLSNACVELPPELCSIIMSPISISTLHSFSLVPSIMHRLESMLLALSLKKLQSDHCTQNVIIPTIKVLEAITTKKCQEGFSLESLETLGDSFLKYAAGQHLFKANQNHHEGLLSVKKDRIVSNASLYKLGYNCKLPGFIRNECFNPKLWVIPGDHTGSHLLDELLFSSTRKIYCRGIRHIKVKVVADVVEALIGAYLSTSGELAALFFMDWLGIKVDFVNILHERPFLVHPEMHANVSYLESVLNYTFRDPSLLIEALTHGSYMLPVIPRCYQVFLVNIVPHSDVTDISITTQKLYVAYELRVTVMKFQLQGSSMHKDINLCLGWLTVYGAGLACGVVYGQHFLKETQIYTFIKSWILALHPISDYIFGVLETFSPVQRLEFLGDSVLDYLITRYLYSRYPGISPGLLTDLRSASVNNDFYAQSSIKAGLHKHFLHASSELHKQITFIVTNFGQLSLGSTFGWESETAFPKASRQYPSYVLGDIIESLAGAIFVDSGYNKEAVWESIRPLLEPLVTPDTVRLHPVRELVEVCQKNSFEKRIFKSCQNGLSSITVEVEAMGVLYSNTSAKSDKKTAKRLAAKAVLESLKKNIPGI